MIKFLKSILWPKPKQILKEYTICILGMSGLILFISVLNHILTLLANIFI